MSEEGRSVVCFNCPNCGAVVSSYNAKRCRACGRAVEYRATGSQIEPMSEDEVDEVFEKGKLFLGDGGEPIKTRRQLTPIETMRPVEICAHVNALRGEQLHRTLRGLVQKLIVHPLNQNWFNAPVDPIACGIPDYFDVIKYPADLGTIKSKLANLEYPDVRHFATEVRLVFMNAKTYNPPTNAVHQAAIDMLKDFEAELERSVARAQRAVQRVDEHACGLCQGKQCVLCGEKCLTFETPALICSGPCGQKIKRDQFYHVTRDGSRLWCHKCYLGLKAIIPPPAEAYYAQSHVEPYEFAIPSTSSLLMNSTTILLPNGNAGLPQDTDQKKKNAALTLSIDTTTTASTTNPAGATIDLSRQVQTQTAGTLWYKRDLMKRKFDEDVAEPWVQCDACSRWLHQTCALFNAKAEADSSADSAQRFVCPLCELQIWAKTTPPPQQQQQQQVETKHAIDHVVSTTTEKVIEDTVDDSEAESGGGSSSAVPAPRNENDDEDMMMIASLPVQRPLKLAALTPTRVALDIDASAVFTRPKKSQYKEDLSYCAHSSDDDDRLKKNNVQVGHQEDEKIIELRLKTGRSWHTAAVDAFSDDEQEAEYASGVGDNNEEMKEDVNLPLKKWWSARSLRRTRMSDHLEEAVRRRMRTMGDAEALRLADTVCVRVLSAVPQSLRVPAVLRANFANPGGGPVPEVLPFESRAVALFQRTDGVDLCVFAMYVHEFGDQGSEGPSTKRVYLAYLDSVEYFRPRTARTAVYHELIAAYLDWSRKRGFESAHIWACPPQRGNNFIFWCHPPHQRTPSRDRLGEWYRAMVKRALAVGAVTRVRTLYDDYFAHLDEQRRRRPSGSGPPPSSSSYNNRSQRPSPSRLRHVDSLCSVDSDFQYTTTHASGTTNNNNGHRLLSGLPWDVHENNNAGDDQASLSIHTGSVMGPENDSASVASFAQFSAHSGTLPLCPPLFDGDYWPEEAIRLHGVIERRRGSFSSRGLANPYAGSLRSAGEASIAQQLDALLKYIAQQPSAYPFMRPVDPVLLGIPDYLTVIQKPMDLGTIETNLKNGAYAVPHAFIEDLRLVFANAQRYNPPAHPVHEAASHLSLLLEKRVQALLLRLKQKCKAQDTRDVLHYFPLADSEITCDCAATLAANKAAALAGFVPTGPSRPIIPSSAPPPSKRQPPESPRTRNRCSLDQHPDKVPPPSVAEEDEQRVAPIPERPRVTRTITDVTTATREAPPAQNEPNNNSVPFCPRLPIELAPSVFKMKDALFVLHLQPEIVNEDDERAIKRQCLDSSNALTTSREEPLQAGHAKVKPGRKRRLAYAPVVPTQETPEAIASDAQFYRSTTFFAQNEAIVDPDAGALLSSSLLDSRHTFLEMCQFWNYQFDSLRRAKHSSAMLLYHLHNPRVDSLRILCSHCSREIRRVRWHCATCVDYNICRDCEKLVRDTHLHTLTPYRISFSRRRHLSTSG